MFGTGNDRYKDVLHRSFGLLVKCLTSRFEDLLHLSQKTISALIEFKQSTLKTDLEAAYDRTISGAFLSKSLQPLLGPFLQNLLPPNKLTVQQVGDPPPPLDPVLMYQPLLLISLITDLSSYVQQMGTLCPVTIDTPLTASPCSLSSIMCFTDQGGGMCIAFASQQQGFRPVRR